MKIKTNQKGLTLVECIVAMTLLGIMSSMFVTAAVYAAKANKENHFREQEMHTQAIDAAQYNSNRNYGIDEVRVTPNSTSAIGANEFELKADFGGISWDTLAYGYKSKLNLYDADAAYQLKFFEARDVAVSPDPANGTYWIKIYNTTSTPMDIYVESPDMTGGRFFDSNINAMSSSIAFSLLSSNYQQFGFKVGATEYFTISQTANIFDPSHDTSTDFTITASNIDYFCGTDATGASDGEVGLYYINGTYVNHDEYLALLGI